MKVLVAAAGAAALLASTFVDIDIEPDEHLVFVNNCDFAGGADGEKARSGHYFACALAEMIPYDHAACLLKSVRMRLPWGEAQTVKALEQRAATEEA